MPEKLITWNNRFDRIDTKAEIAWIRHCEHDGHTHMSARKRFLQFIHCMRFMEQTPKTVLDVGGNRGTGRWFASKLPDASVTILNASPKELGGWKPFIKADAAHFILKKKFDLIILGELLEHVYNPDGVLASAMLSLAPGGYIYITTPNLACIYNRFFLLLGFSTMNYFPSLRYRSGNPVLGGKKDEFGVIPDHKSVFTWRGLVDLLHHYGYEIIHSDGYDYGQKEPFRTVGDRYYHIPVSGPRSVLNELMPKSWREGMTFLCRISKNASAEHARKGLYRGSVWDL
ncbi:MAG: class I SAM-dependent methyltransferase [Spirochaetes bacterium]|nr:class I SAM-dependent methyltransferase [Spirochaetota bacterium]